MAHEKSAQLSDDTYVIMVADCVVATDLAQTVAEFCPQAYVIQKMTAADVLALAAKVARIRVAFIDEPPQRFARAALSRLIAEKRGQVIFIGDDAESVGCAAREAVLDRPFSTPIVLALLARLRKQAAESDAQAGPELRCTLRAVADKLSAGDAFCSASAQAIQRSRGSFCYQPQPVLEG